MAFYNGFKEADTSRNVIMGKLETKEIEKAKALSTEYIEKYHTNLNGDDTDRDKECKHLYPWLLKMLDFSATEDHSTR